MTLLAVFVLSICTAMPALAADWTGFPDGYYGETHVNQFLLNSVTGGVVSTASDNFTLTKGRGGGGPTYSAAAYEVTTWNDLAPGNTLKNIPVGEDARVFLAKIISSGYPPARSLSKTTRRQLPAHQAQVPLRRILIRRVFLQPLQKKRPTQAMKILF